jgi:transposase
MHDLIMGLREDWLQLDERIETVSLDIEKISHDETHCQRLMTVPGIGPIISTAVVAAVGSGEAFC